MGKNPYAGFTLSTGLRIECTEQEAASRPTRSDYAETKRLLRDFGVYGVTVPQVNSLNELLRWRSTAINARLQCGYRSFA